MLPTAAAPNSTPSELEMADVLEAMRTRGDRKTKRRPRLTKRHRWQARLEVDVDDGSVGGVGARKLMVQAVDISACGAGLKASCFVAIGATVWMTLPLEDQPAVLGVVRHCTYLGGTEHRIGVEFLRIERSLDQGNGR